MLIFRLIHDWNSNNNDSWNELIKKHLGDTVHPNRRMGFIRSREALMQCFAEAGHHLTIDQLEVESFSQLKNIREFKISLAHNPQWGAALIADSSQYLSIGIDIEERNREVKNTILERIGHPDDLKISPILNWAIKEAAFKALMNSHRFEKPIEFSSIQIMKNEFLHQGSELGGKWEQIPHESLIIVQAWIKKI